MTLLATLAVGCFLFSFGRLLVKHLGWPTTMQGAGRWGLALLIVAVLIPGLPELWARLSPRIPPLSPIELPELVGTLLLVGLGVLGYVAWTRGREGGKTSGEKIGPRRRALPPPPTELDEQDLVEDETFAPANAEDDHAVEG